MLRSRLIAFLLVSFIGRFLSAQELIAGPRHAVAGVREGIAAVIGSGRAAASNGEGFLVAWNDVRSSDRSRTGGHATRVAADGTLLDTASIALPLIPFAAVWAGDHWAIAGSYTAGDCVNAVCAGIVRLSREGVLLDPQPHYVATVTLAYNLPYRPSFAWTGSAYLLPFRTSAGPEVRTVDRELNVVATERFAALNVEIRVCGDGDSAVALFQLDSRLIAASFGSDGRLRKTATIYSSVAFSAASIGTTGMGEYAYAYVRGGTVAEAVVFDRDLNARHVGSSVPWSGVRNSASPDLAWDGERFTFFITSQAEGNPGAQQATISALRFTPTSGITNVIPETFASLNTTTSVPIIYAVAASGSLLVLADERIADGSFVWIQVGAGARTPVSRGAFAQELSAAASGAAQSLVVWQERTGLGSPYALLGTRLDRGGRPVDAEPLRIATGACTMTRPAVAAAGSGFLVLWQDGSHIASATVSADGVVGTRHTVPLESTACARAELALVANDSEYLGVWSAVTPTGYIVRAVRLAADGTPLGTSMRLATVAGIRDTHVAAASDGRDFLVGWLGSAVRVTADGAVIGFPAGRLGTGEVETLWWNGSEYVAAILHGVKCGRSIGAGTVSFARLGRDGAMLGSLSTPVELPHADRTLLPHASICDASGCSVPLVTRSLAGEHALSLLRFDDSGTEIRVRTQSVRNLRLEQFGGIPSAGLIPGARPLLVLQERPHEKPFSGVDRVIVRGLFEPKRRAVAH